MVTEVAVEASEKKAVAVVENYGWLMYKDVQPTHDAYPTVVAMKHGTQGQGVFFCHVISKPCKAQKLCGGQFEHAERAWVMKKGACCLKIRALKLVHGQCGRQEIFEYASEAVDFPLADTILPHISEGKISPHTWLTAAWHNDYIKITPQVQQKFST